MSARPALALAAAAAAALAAGGVAQAAPAKKAATPPPVCHLITDPSGDAHVVTSQPSMDILSADIASDAKNVTAVIRLSAPPAGANPQAPGGTDYYLSFSAPGSANPQYLHMSMPFVGSPTFTTGQTTKVGGQNTSTDDAAPATGAVVGKSVVVTASTSAFGGRVSLKPGATLTGLTAAVYAQIGAPRVGGLLENADTASGTKPYTAGAPSCVVPGKG